MPPNYKPSLSHFGVFCYDIDLLKAFYCGVFDLRETDRGTGITFPFTIVFLSGNDQQHHQLALASHRTAPQALPARSCNCPSKCRPLSTSVKPVAVHWHWGPPT
jgi:catechol 2,3-dioxygenase-like lactoylglutathione lyase family enzyme